MWFQEENFSQSILSFSKANFGLDCGDFINQGFLERGEAAVFAGYFWSSSTLPRLVVLRCVVLPFVVCFVSRCVVLCCVVLRCVALCCVVLCCVVLCCDVMLCVVICLLLVTLVCWLEISQFSSSFIARLDATTRRTYNGTTNSTT